MLRGKVIGGLAVLFIAGVLSGVAGTSFYHTYEREQRGELGAAAQHERIMTRLTQELGLTAEQRADIEPIVMRAHLAILELRYAHQAEIETILSNGMVDLNAKLSREQQNKLAEVYARLQRRWTRSRDYLDAMKKRAAWVAPSNPRTVDEPVVHVYRNRGASRPVYPQDRFCDEPAHRRELSGCFVKIGQ